MIKYQPNENVPPEFLTASRKLYGRKRITKREFIDLCKLAVKLAESGRTDTLGRSHMAYHITGLWLAHKNIGSASLLSGIGGQFGELEIEGSFDLDSEFDRKRWQELKEGIIEADRKYTRKPPTRHKDTPADFLTAAEKLLAQKKVTEREYIDLCLLAVKVIDFGKTNAQTNSNVASYLAEIWHRNPHISHDKLLGDIGAEFDARQAPDGFNLEYILDKHHWENLKGRITEADERYPTANE